MSVIEVDAVSKSYPTPDGALDALEQVSLIARSGEFVSVIGPSGCGKSTLFNIIAGLEEPSAGCVRIDDVEVTDRRGRVAYMPQRDALLPWRNVLDNAVLATVVQRGDVRAARREAEALLGDFGLEGFGEALPATLSGGMRQRVALLRTVLWRRPIMLLDEPFGALDALTRAQLQQWLLGLWSRLDHTILMVTHDVDEALLLSDRVYVLTPRPGRVALELALDLPRPRTYNIIASAAFLRYKTHLLRALGQIM